MENSRIIQNPVEYPKLRIDKDIFDFANKLSVGDKGVLRFSANIVGHEAEESDEKPESKSLRLTNLKSVSDSARLT